MLWSLVCSSAFTRVACLDFAELESGLLRAPAIKLRNKLFQPIFWGYLPSFLTCSSCTYCPGHIPRVSTDNCFIAEIFRPGWAKIHIYTHAQAHTKETAEGTKNNSANWGAIAEGSGCSSHSKASSQRGTRTAVRQGRRVLSKGWGEGGFKHRSPCAYSWRQGNIAFCKPWVTRGGELTPAEQGGVHGKGYTTAVGNLTALGRVLPCLGAGWAKSDPRSAAFGGEQRARGSCTAGAAELADSTLHLQVSGRDCFLVLGLQAPIRAAVRRSLRTTGQLLRGSCAPWQQGAAFLLLTFAAGIWAASENEGLTFSAFTQTQCFSDAHTGLFPLSPPTTQLFDCSQIRTALESCVCSSSFPCPFLLAKALPTCFVK